MKKTLSALVAALVSLNAIADDNHGNYNVPNCLNDNFKNEVIYGLSSFLKAMANNKKPEYFGYHKYVQANFNSLNVTLFTSQRISPEELVRANGDGEMNKINSNGQPVFDQYYKVEGVGHFKAIIEYYSYCEFYRDKHGVQTFNNIGDVYLLAR